MALADDFVLRVIAAASRLHREAKVAARLPREARYPGVLDAGDDGDIEWLITRRVRGDAVLGAWPMMIARDRERATRDLAAALHAFHAAPADGLAGELDPPHTLPLDALLALTSDLELEASVRARWPAFDVGLVHGDPHLENVLWDARSSG